MPVHLQHGFIIACFYNTILAGASTVVVVGVLHELVGFLFVFSDAILACGDARVAVGAWSDGHQQQRVSGCIWSLLGTGTRLVSPFVISLLGCRISCFLTGHKYSKVRSVGYVFS